MSYTEIKTRESLTIRNKKKERKKERWMGSKCSGNYTALIYIALRTTIVS